MKYPDMNDLVAVVSGASRGIGAAIVKSLADNGVKIAGIARTEASAAAGLAAAHGAIADVDFLPIGADVSKSAEVDAAAEKILGHFSGRVDILIHNAGITSDMPYSRMKPEAWEKVIATNLSAAFYLTRAFSKPLLESTQGRVVYVGSGVGVTGNICQANYAASKSGLAGLMLCVIKDNKRFSKQNGRLTINEVDPGVIEGTDMTKGILANDEKRAKILGGIPLGRLGSPEDVAKVVTFVCSGDAGYIHGAKIPVDGGVIIGGLDL